MRVLVVVRWPVGGIRTYLKYLYAQPAFADCEITIVAPLGETEGPISDDQVRARVTIESTGNSQLSIFAGVRRVLGGNGFNLIHSHGLTAGMMSEFTRRRSRIAHIVTIHDMFVDSLFEGWRGRARLWAVNRQLAGATAVHCVSSDCATNFSEYVNSVAVDKVRAIPNGICVERFLSARPSDLRSRLGIAGNRAIVGFFGRFLAPKGFRVLVDAVEILVSRYGFKDFVVVTFGWGGFIREDYQYLAEKGLSDYFIQRMHTDEPEREMKALDLLVMPSMWEAAGLVAMEALVAGVPLVGTNCVGLREVLGGTPAAVVEPGDASGTAAALHRELNEPRRDDFAAYSATAADRFDIRRCAAAVRDLYREIT